MFREPFCSNLITYQKVDGEDAYLVTDRLAEEEDTYTVPGEHLRLAKRFDGRTSVHDVLSKYSFRERMRMVRTLQKEGLIRTDGGWIHAEDGTIKTLVIAKHSPARSCFARGFNRMLILLFLPMFILGMYARFCLEPLDSLLELELLLDQSIASYVLGFAVEMLLVYSVSIGFHELCHGLSCTAYDGYVMEYGYLHGAFFPAFCTLMDEKPIKSKAKRLQVIAAGVEGNFLLAGLFFGMPQVIPFLHELFYYAGQVNIVLGLTNLLFLPGTDGGLLLEILLGTEECLKLALKTVKNFVRRGLLWKNKLFLLPMASCILAVTKGRFCLSILAVFAVFFLVGMSQSCRYRENMWVFILMGITVIPVNIAVCALLREYVNIIYAVDGLWAIPIYIMLFATLFSVEQIVFGMIARLLWIKQEQ